MKCSPFSPSSRKCFSISFVFFREIEAPGADVCTDADQNFMPQCPGSTWGFSDVLESSGDKTVSVLLHIQGVTVFGGVINLSNWFPSLLDPLPPLFFAFLFLSIAEPSALQSAVWVVQYWWIAVVSSIPCSCCSLQVCMWSGILPSVKLLICSIL